jgi:ribosomal protein S18 acetylase RimI-like enzyme
MPEIKIRTVETRDIESLTAFEHGYYSEFVWQMGIDQDFQSYQTGFNRVRLPRRVFVPYPRKREDIFADIDKTETFLVAVLSDRPVGYIKLIPEKGSQVLKVSDIVVSASMRRQGIASGLLIAAMNLAANRNFTFLVLEMQSKNDPAIEMAVKLGFNLSGFRDHYFPNQDLALFFSRLVR